ncbi:MAG: DoxX family membrane protein [Candidatus Binataceae bacterium]
MKVARLIPRLLLGLIFLVFGLNGFLHFLPQPPMSGPPADFFKALYATNYMLPLIFGAQTLGGVLLLIGVAVPVALLILAPVILNILAFHLMFAPAGIGPGLVVTALELFLAWTYRDKFLPLFSS